MSNNVNQFDFSTKGICKVLNERLKVPKYQREYSWEIEQVEQLLEDINRAYRENVEYFLGTIVTINNEKENLLEIVDGQQRLTTTTLLIVSFREYLKNIEGGEILIQSIENDFLYTIDRKKRIKVSRLILNIDDNEFFKQLVSEDEKPKLNPTRQSHHLLVDAIKICRNWVHTQMQACNKSDRLDAIVNWITFLEEKATIILLKTQNGAQAFKMFETLNDRGLRTSQADLVKSYLFGQSGSRIDEAQSRWSSMRDNIDQLDDDDRTVNFLRHTLIATKQFVRAQEVYEVTQTKYTTEESSLSLLSKLEEYSKIYVATFNHDSSHWKGYSVKSKNALGVFQKFNLQPMRPLLLSLAIKFSKKEFEKAMGLLTSIAVRAVISGKTRSGVNEQAFAKAALSVFERNIKTYNELKKELKSILISDKEFKEAFVNARSSKAELMRYYLRAIELAWMGNSNPWFVPNEDQTQINLEHILPKKPDFSDWKKFKPEVHRLYLSRMGNQCLLIADDNAADGNGKFSLKKPDYKKSPYYFTKLVSKVMVWSPEEIDKRQRQMADMAIKTWKY